MSGLWLVTSNDRKLLPCALVSAGMTEECLTVSADAAYGAAVFASGSDVLTIKRPVTAGFKLAGLDGTDIRSNRFLGHLQDRNGQAFRVENAQPFRYKGWVMAHFGNSPPELKLPKDEIDAGFIRQHLKGNSTEEFLFHMVLANLYRNHPPGPDGTRSDVITQAVIETLNDKALKKHTNFTLGLTCETKGVVISKGREVKYRTIKKVSRCSRCTVGKHVVSHNHLHAVVVVDGFDVKGSQWKQLPEDKVLVVGSEPPVKLLSIEG